MTRRQTRNALRVACTVGALLGAAPVVAAPRAFAAAVKACVDHVRQTEPHVAGREPFDAFVTDPSATRATVNRPSFAFDRCLTQAGYPHAIGTYYGAAATDDDVENP
jgi:hypothetical protein